MQTKHLRDSIVKLLVWVLQNVFFRIWFPVCNYFASIFSETIRAQLSDPSTIPVVIISYNRLKCLESLVNNLIKNGVKNIVIVDNNSTYPPLLAYYEVLPSNIRVVRRSENAGHLVFWRSDDLLKEFGSGYYVVTDSDVIPVDSMPKDFMAYLLKVLQASPTVNKVGFSLKIDDIPDSNPTKRKVLEVESSYWLHPRKDGNFLAPIDTTFAMYRPVWFYIIRRYLDKRFYLGIRLCPPYLATHEGWYIDQKNLSVEDLYYIGTANSSSSFVEIVKDVVS